MIWRESVRPLSEVAEVIRGVSFDKSEVRSQAEDGYFPILRAGNIGEALDTQSDLVWVPASRVGSNQLLRPGDIAICMSSGSPRVVGKSAPLMSAWVGSVGAFCAIIRPLPQRIEPSFLAYFLGSPSFRSWTAQSEGANIKNIRRSELLLRPIPLPPIAEQRRIVDLLSRAENIVRMRREAEAKAQNVAPGIFHEVFDDLERNPNCWPMVRLGDVCSIEAPLRIPAIEAEGNEPCIGPDAIEPKTGRLIAEPTVREVAPISGKYWYHAGDVLYSKIRPALVKAVIAPTDGYCSADMYPIRSSEAIRKEFLHQVLLSNSFTRYAVGHSSRAQMPKINRGVLLSFRFPQPPAELQQRFAELTRVASHLVARLSVARQTAQESFASLAHSIFGA